MSSDATDIEEHLRAASDAILSLRSRGPGVCSLQEWQAQLRAEVLD